MGFFEKALGAISPGWAASRAQNRLRLRAYEAANPTRLHKGKRESRSADTAVFAAGTSLREQARWLDENHDLVIGLFDKMEDRVIGAHGIHVEPQPLDLEGNLHSEFAGQLSALWAEWSVRPEVTGMFTRPEAERLLLRSALRDGEVFTQMVRGNVAGLQHSTQVPFSLELLEADFVPFNLNSTSGQQIRQGIIVNAWGRPTGYRVYKNHPASFAGLNAGLKTVSADSMLHLAMRKRLHQLRGITYSSQRQELVESFEGYNVLQQWFVGQQSRPVYRNWLAMTLLSGVTIPKDVDKKSLYNALYLGPVMPWIDPGKEAAAWKAIVRGGAGTEAEWTRARGKNPQEVKRQRLRETQFNRENGLVFDSDAANDKGVLPDAANDKPAPSRDDD
ncbi:phage portal protein [Citrobacter pasteurii]